MTYMASCPDVRRIRNQHQQRWLQLVTCASFLTTIVLIHATLTRAPAPGACATRSWSLVMGGLLVASVIKLAALAHVWVRTNKNAHVFHSPDACAAVMLAFVTSVTLLDAYMPLHVVLFRTRLGESDFLVRFLGWLLVALLLSMVCQEYLGFSPARGCRRARAP